jgi:hypothetical protein
MNWLICNKECVVNEKLLNRVYAGKYMIASDKEFYYDAKNEINFLIDGYIIPRVECYSEYKDADQFHLVSRLYSKSGKNFINSLKGIFTIILVERENVTLFNDIHNISVSFYYKTSDLLIVSNQLENIKQNIPLLVDYEEAALFCLFNHFLPGHTMFKEVKTTLPSSVLEINDSEKTISQYWKPESLFELKVRKVDHNELASAWFEIISNSIDYLNPKKIVVTMTGGNDSRMIVASLLKKNLEFNGYTYGNPESRDGVIASLLQHRISKMNYHCYYAQEANFEWLKKLSTYILENGNSLVNIHRAHRLDAFQNEMINNPENEMLITGMLGGDYIKAYNRKMNIMMRICLLFEEHRHDFFDSTLIGEMKRLFIDISKVDINKIKKLINEWGVFNIKQKKIREFYYMYHMWGCMHHSQDARLYSQVIPYNLNPFMDIDFLELLAKAGNSLLIKGSGDLISRAFSSKFQVQITDLFAPQLSDVPYAKNGMYTARDYLHKPVKQLVGRLKDLIRNNPKYPSNFPVGDWYKEMISYENLFDEGDIMDLFNQKEFISFFNNWEKASTEESWYIYTNPLNLRLNYGKWAR